MGSEAEYRHKAEEYYRAAEATNDPGQKLALLQMAQRWLSLAERMEAINARAHPGKAGKEGGGPEVT